MVINHVSVRPGSPSSKYLGKDVPSLKLTFLHLKMGAPVGISEIPGGGWTELSCPVHGFRSPQMQTAARQSHSEGWDLMGFGKVKALLRKPRHQHLLLGDPLNSVGYLPMALRRFHFLNPVIHSQTHTLKG